MKKKLLACILAGMLLSLNTNTVFAAQTENTETAAEESEAEEGNEDTEGEAAEAETTEGETAEGETAEETGIVINTGNLVEAETIDLSLHSETTGDFTAVYAYENPFKGKDTSKGVVLEFYAQPTWEVHELGTIFAFNGTGDYDGKLYFTPGSYLGFNSAPFGGFFDANLFNYKIVTDYIKDGAKIRIEIVPEGFSVYANDTLCYDQTILDDPNAAAGDFTSSSDFSGVLSWLSGAEVLYFGYGSWWNEAGTNEANINLSQVNFRLQDGTVVMDKIMADKDLVESLGGSLTAESETVEEVKIESVEVEVFDINSVEYEGESVLPTVAAVVIAAAVLALLTVVVVTKKRKYPDT